MALVRCWMALRGRGCTMARRAGNGFVAMGVLAWAVIVQPPAVRAEYTPRVYGGAGSFSTTPTHVDAVAVAGWAFGPGQAAYFPAVAADGTIFVANLPQTLNQMLPTACSMVITCFNPDQPVCDDGSGGGSFFSNLHVPDINGALAQPSECPVSHRLESFASGADVSDLEVIEDPGAEGGERVVFTSGWGSSTGRLGFPAFGSLVKRGGRWTVDVDARRWSDDLHRASAAGAAACPATSDGDAWCGSFSEMERLPHSGRLVIGQYATPGLVVTDGHGVVLAHHAFGPLTDPCSDKGERVVRLPREIDVDPTSVPGDERFVVIFDNPNGLSQPLQEFSYNDARQTLTPTSAAVSPESGVRPAPRCLAKYRQVIVAQYDADGTLWVGQGQGSGALLGFVKSRTTAKREALEEACSPRDGFGQDRPWGSPCSADLDAGLGTRPFRDGRSMPSFVNLVEDRATRDLLGVGFLGGVWRLERTPSRGGLAVTWAEPTDMFFADLQPTAADESRWASKGIVDVVRRALWVPVHTYELVGPAGCGFWDCDPVTGQRRNQYLYELDADRLPDRGARVTGVEVPETLVEGRPFSVTIEATLPGSFDRRQSTLSLFDKSSPRPLTTRSFRRRCSADGCRFTARIPARFTARRRGELLSWHAFLADDAGASLHTAGVVSIGR